MPDVKEVLIEVEEGLLSAASAGWHVVRDAVAALEPAAEKVLKDLLNEAVTDLEQGFSVDVIVTKVLNLAEAGGHDWVLALETSVLRGLAGLLGAKAS